MNTDRYNTSGYLSDSEATTISNRIKAAWTNHKKATGMSQLQGAEQLGMTQSAFSQYIRGKNNGGVPPNKNFITKFCNLVCTTPEELGWHEELATTHHRYLPVKYTFSGQIIYDQFIQVTTPVDAKGVFAVKNDSKMALNDKEYYLMSFDEPILDGDVVWYVSKNVISFGTIKHDGDTWSITTPFNGVSSTVIDVDTPNKLCKVLGTCYQNK